MWPWEVEDCWALAKVKLAQARAPAPYVVFVRSPAVLRQRFTTGGSSLSSFLKYPITRQTLSIA
jgi:hypothetical protein